ncbi:MAG: alanine racemase [Pseudomonadota bacterium]
MSAQLRVSRSALRANYHHLEASTAGPVGAVVKADAYGLGAHTVVACLIEAGCSTFFVATAAEALALRQHYESITLYVFAGADHRTAPLLAEQRIQPLLNTPAQIESWRRLCAGAPCGLQIDTGMARLGFDWRDPAAVDSTGLELSLLSTHFACADEPDARLNVQQIERFRPWVEAFSKVPVSLGNSAAGLASAIPTFGLTRAGIVLYGGNPFAEQPNPMRPVVCLDARILQLREVLAGDSAGYGATWIAPEGRTLAVLGMGYADGLPRSLSNSGTVIVDAQPCPIVGRVSMDAVQVDVTGRALSEGDWVQLIGPQQSLDAFAAQQQTIPYEVLTRLGPRVERRYVD